MLILLFLFLKKILFRDLIWGQRGNTWDGSQANKIGLGILNATENWPSVFIGCNEYVIKRA